MTDIKTVAVLGGGSFGTAIANMIAEKGHRATLWMRNGERAQEINAEHCNRHYLPDYSLHEGLYATAELSEAVAGADVVFMAVPSKSCREVANALAACIESKAILVSTTKGIEPDGFKLMSQVLAEVLPNTPLGVMSGPNLAKEVAARQLTGTVIASENEQVITTIQGLLHSSYFRVYASSDMFGVELGGALKNIYAIMSGMGAALGLGQNTIGMLITRSLAEMSRFAVQMGADPMTFLGLSGVGDLIVTCMSPLSRNYRVGYELGKGTPLEQIIAELGQVAEGVNTLKIVKHKSDELDVYMPLVGGMYEILFNHRSIGEVVGSLMLAEQSDDVEFVS